MSERLKPEEIVLVRETTIDGNWMVMIENTDPPRIVAKFYDREAADCLAEGVRQSLAVVTAERDAAVRERDYTIDLLVKSIGRWWVRIDEHRKILLIEKDRWTLKTAGKNDSKSFDSILDAIRAAMSNNTKEQ